jgi:hypothetical protein
MKRKTSVNRVLQSREWVIGSAAVLLLLSAGGLTLLAQHAYEQGNVAGVLLALHLAFWSYVLGIARLVLFPIFRLIDWLRMPVKRQSMSRSAFIEPGRRNVEQPEMEGTPSLQRDVAPVALNSVSRQSDDQYKVTSSTKVA